jgi:tetratricopeptide (TPR) repeat protein
VGTLRWLPVALVCGLTLWAYAPALDAGFVFDDESNIVDSPAVHWNEISRENLDLLLGSSLLTRRPVANLTFAADHLLGELNPRGYHVTNLLVHLAVGGALVWLSLLYVRVARRRVPRGVQAAAVLLPALIFLVHPLNTQAVTYVVQRMASLAALFSLLAFGTYLVARHKLHGRSGWWYGLTVVLWGLGLGSKENAVLLLPVVLLYEGCFFRAEWRGRVQAAWSSKRGRGVALGVAAVAGVVLGVVGWSLVRSFVPADLSTQFAGRTFSGWERVLTQTRVQFLYAFLFLWPSPARLSLEHDFSVSRGLLDPPTTLIAAWVGVVALAVSFFLAVRRPRYGFPLLAYFAFHAIESGPFNLELVFEHRMYLPMTMLVLLGAALLADARPRRAVAAGAVLMVLCIPLAAWTHERNLVWADPIELQRDIALKSPANARAQHNLASALLDGGLLEEALPFARLAITLDSADARPRMLLGHALLGLERPEEALEAYQAAMMRVRGTPEPALGVGRALEAMDRGEEAFQHYVRTGTAFGRSGMAWEAIPLLEQAVAIQPERAEARSVLGSALFTAGLTERALAEYRSAVELDSGNVEAWYNVGIAADALGLREEAVRAYRGFIDRAPASLQAAVERALGRISELEPIG